MLLLARTWHPNRLHAVCYLAPSRGFGHAVEPTNVEQHHLGLPPARNIERRARHGVVWCGGCCCVVLCCVVVAIWWWWLLLLLLLSDRAVRGGVLKILNYSALLGRLVKFSVGAERWLVRLVPRNTQRRAVRLASARGIYIHTYGVHSTYYVHR